MSADHPAAGAAVDPSAYGLRQWSGWLLGPAALLGTLILPPPEGLSVEGWRTAGAALLMAVFWIAESIPIPATALLPLVLFPLLQLGDVRETAEPYANPVIYLFLGGFLIALAMQRWNLHRRVAVTLIGWLGTRPAAIIAGVLLSSALVSMWVSNTATSLMMLPIALSVVQLFPEAARSGRELRDFGTALLLAVAYGATTGGMGTLIGTPPNALLAGFMSETYGVQIGFIEWMFLGVPIVVVSLPVAWLVLTRWLSPVGSEPIAGSAAPAVYFRCPTTVGMVRRSRSRRGSARIPSAASTSASTTERSALAGPSARATSSSASAHTHRPALAGREVAVHDPSPYLHADEPPRELTVSVVDVTTGVRRDLQVATPDQLRPGETTGAWLPLLHAGGDQPSLWFEIGRLDLNPTNPVEGAFIAPTVALVGVDTVSGARAARISG